MTYDFTVQIDFHEGEAPVNPIALARAIYFAIIHATETDSEGTEILDYRVGQVSVRPQEVADAD